MVDTAAQLTSARKRRGLVKASITHMEDRVQILELKRELLHADFKKHHYSIVELLEDEGDLDQERATLDDHDDRIADFIGRLQVLIEDKDGDSPTESTTSALLLGKQLDRVKRKIIWVQDSVDAAQLELDIDRCLLQQLEEQIHVASLKHDLSNVGERVALLDKDRPDLSDLEDDMDKVLSKLSLQIKRLLSDKVSTALSTSSTSGVKLPRIDLPTFDGNIANWVNFWEQFEAAIHGKRQLSNADKLTYLQHTLKVEWQGKSLRDCRKQVTITLKPSIAFERDMIGHI